MNKKRFTVLLVSTLLTMYLCNIAIMPKVKAEAIPTPVVSGINSSYMLGSQISLKLTSTGVSKLVQYKAVLTNKTTRESVDLLNGFTSKYYNPQYKYALTFAPKTAGTYSLAITSKLGGYKASYSKTIVKEFTIISNGMIISEIEPVILKTNIGDTFSFPEKVKATMKDGYIKEYPVTWDSMSIKTDVLGEQIFYGTVSGYTEKVKLTVNVVDEKIISVDPINVSVNEGSEYKFPEKVTAKLKNGTMEAAVKWNAALVDTNVPGKYNYEGIVDGFNGKVNLSLTINPVNLNFNLAKVSNLKEIVLTFNKRVDIASINNENFRIFKGTTQISTDVKLLDDYKTVVISVPALNSSLENNGRYIMVVERVKDLNGTVMETALKDVISEDSKKPEVLNVYSIGPYDIMVEFSEPIKNTEGKLVEIRKNGILITSSPILVGFETNKINIGLTAAMVEDGTYDIYIKGLMDFAGKQIDEKTYHLTYKKNTEPISVKLDKIDPAYIVVSFNKPVRGLTKDSFYYSNSSKKPIDIYSDFSMKKTVQATQSVNKVWIKFYDPVSGTGNTISDKQDKLFILGKANGYEIRDAWGNLFTNVEIPVSVFWDKSAPEVDEINVDSEASFIIQFSENVKFNGTNIELIDEKGIKVSSLVIPYSDNRYKIDLGKNYSGHKITVKIKDTVDKALIPNKLESYSTTIDITDKTPPIVKKVIKKFVNGLDQALYISFTEQVNETALDISNYYLQNPSSGLMVKLTEKPSTIDENKTIRLPLTDEQKDLINKGYNLFVSDVQDTYKNPLLGQIVQNSNIAAFDSNENRPKIIKLDVIDKKTLMITFDQYIKRVDMNVFLLNGSAPAEMSVSLNDEGNTVVSLTTAAGREFLPDLRGLTLLNVIPTADNKIENNFGLGVENGYYTTTTPIKIQDKMPPAIKMVSGSAQIKALTNTIGIIDAIVIEYVENIDSTKLSALSYNVEGRTIARVYTNSTGTKGTSSVGNFVIIELRTEGITQSSATSPVVKQVLDIYDMFDNKLSTDGQSIAPQNYSGPSIINRISSQISKGETRVVTFTKPLSEASKILVQNIITVSSRGRGTLIFTWSENRILSITNISTIEATDFWLSSPTKVTLTGADGTLTNETIIIGW